MADTKHNSGGGKTTGGGGDKGHGGDTDQTGAAANPLCTDPVNEALDKLREATEKAKADAAAKSAENDAVKQDSKAQEDDTKQVEQTVKDYYAAYKGIVGARKKAHQASEEARTEAKRHLADHLDELKDCFNHTVQKPDYQLPDLEKLQADVDNARAKYDAAVVNRDLAQRALDSLKGYAAAQQARLGVLNGYATRVGNELKAKNYAAVYMLSSLVRAEEQLDKDAGDPEPPEEFLTDIREAAENLSRARDDLRPLALDYRAKKALLDGAAKRADQIRALRDRDVLAAAAKVDAPAAAGKAAAVTAPV